MEALFCQGLQRGGTLPDWNRRPRPPRHRGENRQGDEPRHCTPGHGHSSRGLLDPGPGSECHDQQQSAMDVCFTEPERNRIEIGNHELSPCFRLRRPRASLCRESPGRASFDFCGLTRAWSLAAAIICSSREISSEESRRDSSARITYSSIAPSKTVSRNPFASRRNVGSRRTRGKYVYTLPSAVCPTSPFVSITCNRLKTVV